MERLSTGVTQKSSAHGYPQLVILGSAHRLPQMIFLAVIVFLVECNGINSRRTGTKRIYPVLHGRGSPGWYISAYQQVEKVVQQMVKPLSNRTEGLVYGSSKKTQTRTQQDRWKNRTGYYQDSEIVDGREWWVFPILFCGSWSHQI